MPIFEKVGAPGGRTTDARTPKLNSPVAAQETSKKGFESVAETIPLGDLLAMEDQKKRLLRQDEVRLQTLYDGQGKLQAPELPYSYRIRSASLLDQTLNLRQIEVAQALIADRLKQITQLRQEMTVYDRQALLRAESILQSHPEYENALAVIEELPLDKEEQKAYLDAIKERILRNSKGAKDPLIIYALRHNIFEREKSVLQEAQTVLPTPSVNATVVFQTDEPTPQPEKTPVSLKEQVTIDPHTLRIRVGTEIIKFRRNKKGEPSIAFEIAKELAGRPLTDYEIKQLYIKLGGNPDSPVSGIISNLKPNLGKFLVSETTAGEERKWTLRLASKENPKPVTEIYAGPSKPETITEQKTNIEKPARKKKDETELDNIIIYPDHQRVIVGKNEPITIKRGTGWQFDVLLEFAKHPDGLSVNDLAEINEKSGGREDRTPEKIIAFVRVKYPHISIIKDKNTGRWQLRNPTALDKMPTAQQKRKGEKEKKSEDKKSAFINRQELFHLVDFTRTVLAKNEKYSKDQVEYAKLQLISGISDQLRPDFQTDLDQLENDELEKKQVQMCYSAFIKIATLFKQEESKLTESLKTIDTDTRKVLEILHEDNNTLLFDIFQNYYNIITKNPKLLNQDTHNAVLERTSLLGRINQIGYKPINGIRVDTEPPKTRNILSGKEKQYRQDLSILVNGIFTKATKEAYMLRDLKELDVKIRKQTANYFKVKGTVAISKKGKLATISFSLEEIVLMQFLTQHATLRSPEQIAAIKELLREEINRYKQSN